MTSSDRVRAPNDVATRSERGAAPESTPAAPAPSAGPKDAPTSSLLREDIERVLHSRVAASGTHSARIEDLLKRSGTRIWSVVKRYPLLGVAVTAAAALGVAAAVGVGEIAFATAAGYAAYKVLRKGVPLDKELEELAQNLEKMG